ncbi:MAG: hypothetical protein KAI66_03885 [Lentisphaeria bacterium]|nr:hypothetical protein [Lentisphaeria bacterium]
MRKKLSLMLVLGAVFFGSSLFAISGSYFYSSCGEARIFFPMGSSSPAYAEYMCGEDWYTDSHMETNPAYVQWLAQGSSCSSVEKEYAAFGGYVAARQTIRRQLNRQAEAERDFFFSRMTMAEAYCYGCYGFCSLDTRTGDSEAAQQAAEEEDEWQFSVSASYQYDHNDFELDPMNDFETNDNTLTISLDVSKGRFVLLNEFRLSQSEGRSDFEGFDSDTVGFQTLLGYRVLEQEDNLVNLTVYGSADISFIDYTQTDTQWRFAPGCGVTLSRATPIGLFQASYAYNWNSNLEGTSEVTNDRYINVHGCDFNYTLPLTSYLYVTTGINYMFMEQIHSDIDNRFSEVRVAAGSWDLAGFDLSVGYYRDIMTTNDYGLDCRVGFSW